MINRTERLHMDVEALIARLDGVSLHGNISLGDVGGPRVDPRRRNRERIARELGDEVVGSAAVGGGSR